MRHQSRSDPSMRIPCRRYSGLQKCRSGSIGQKQLLGGRGQQGHVVRETGCWNEEKEVKRGRRKRSLSWN